MDSKPLRAAQLGRLLVTLDDPMTMGHVHLRAGAGGIPAGMLAAIRGIAAHIGARLRVEREELLEPDAAPEATPVR